jgi:hypothetical protein
LLFLLTNIQERQISAARCDGRAPKYCRIIFEVLVVEQSPIQFIIIKDANGSIVAILALFLLWRYRANFAGLLKP